MEFCDAEGNKNRERLNWISPQRGILLFSNHRSAKAISIAGALVRQIRDSNATILLRRSDFQTCARRRAGVDQRNNLHQASNRKPDSRYIGCFDPENQLNFLPFRWDCVQPVTKRFDCLYPNLIASTSPAAFGSPPEFAVISIQPPRRNHCSPARPRLHDPAPARTMGSMHTGLEEERFGWHVLRRTRARRCGPDRHRWLFRRTTTNA